MFSKFFIERPRFAIVISVIMVLAGLLSLSKLPVAEYPEIAPPSLRISATYTGASASVIAETVAMPIEDQINGVDDLLYFSSTSDNSGNYSCVATFKSGTNSDIAMVNLQNAVKRAESKLPEEVTKRGIEISKRGDDILATFSFMTDGSTLDIMGLGNFVQSNLQDALSRIDGVSNVEITSGREYAMRIWLNPLRMAALNISTQDISDAVNQQNIQAAAGSVGAESSNRFMSYKLNVQGRLKTKEEFENIVIRADSDGSIVRMCDIAKVEIGADSYAGSGRFNGEETVSISVYRDPEANSLATVKLVKAELENWARNYFPPGVSYQVGYDPSEFINATLDEIILTMVSALLLVVLITYLFLQDWRATLIPSIAIPVALLGTFPFMYALGYSINILTMFGLILVIGSLCDDAIVVVENSQALMERERLSPKEAALKSMTQITGAVIATTLVTIACYVPLAFYGGMVGEIYVQFAVTMCISLSLSTVIALTLSPVMCAYLLKKPDGRTPFVFRPFNAFLNFMRTIYLFFVRIFVKQGVLTLLIFVGVGWAIWHFYEKTPSSFLPPEDKGSIRCNIELPMGASQYRTDEVLNEFYNCIKDIPGIRSVLTISGRSTLSGRGENCGMAIIRLENWSERTTPELQIDSIIQQIQDRTEHITDADIVVFTPPAIMGLGSTNGTTFALCSISGAEPQELADTVNQFRAGLESHPDQVRYAMTAYKANTPQLYFNLDREKTETLGVSVDSVFNVLQCNLASLYINDFTLYGRNHDVTMQSTADFRSTLDDVRTIQVPNADGDMVPLAALGQLEFIVGPRQVTRFNKMTSAHVNAQAQSGFTTHEMMNLIESQPLSKDYKIEWTGMSYQEKQNQGQIVFLMAVALLFAYLFLVAQYESWSIPIPVMLAVSFAVLGALIGLQIWHESMSIYAQLGLVMLIGLAAKNAILMVEFSKQEREQGKSVFEAALNGANLRYRAVLMTAWSFLFGVFPLVIATGAGAGSRRAIGITTFSGMALATVIGIVFTPALYAVVQRLREFIKHRILRMPKPAYMLAPVNVAATAATEAAPQSSEKA